jgi:hypothetical protein
VFVFLVGEVLFAVTQRRDALDDLIALQHGELSLKLLEAKPALHCLLKLDP